MAESNTPLIRADGLKLPPQQSPIHSTLSTTSSLPTLSNIDELTDHIDSVRGIHCNCIKPAPNDVIDDTPSAPMTINHDNNNGITNPYPLTLDLQYRLNPEHDEAWYSQSCKSYFNTPQLLRIFHHTINVLIPFYEEATDNTMPRLDLRTISVAELHNRILAPMATVVNMANCEDMRVAKYDDDDFTLAGDDLQEAADPLRDPVGWAYCAINLLPTHHDDLPTAIENLVVSIGKLEGTIADNIMIARPLFAPIPAGYDAAATLHAGGLTVNLTELGIPDLQKPHHRAGYTPSHLPHILAWNFGESMGPAKRPRMPEPPVVMTTVEFEALGKEERDWLEVNGLVVLKEENREEDMSAKVKRMAEKEESSWGMRGTDLGGDGENYGW